MANGVYAATKQLILTGGLNLTSATIKAALIDAADYTVSLSTHDFWDDVATAAKVAVSPALTNKTVVGGVFDADDVTFTAVTGDPCEAIILFVDTGTASTSRLIAYIDTGVTGLPVTPSGADIVVHWNASGIMTWTDA